MKALNASGHSGAQSLNRSSQSKMKLIDDLHSAKNQFASKIKLSKHNDSIESLQKSLEVPDFQELDLKVSLPNDRTPMAAGGNRYGTKQTIDIQDENDSLVHFRNGSNSPEPNAGRRGRSPVQPS